jgi:hypothetical protein
MDLHRSESKPVSYDGGCPLSRSLQLSPSSMAFSARDAARIARTIRPTVLFLWEFCGFFSKRVVVSMSSSLLLSWEAIVTDFVEDFAPGDLHYLAMCALADLNGPAKANSVPHNTTFSAFMAGIGMKGTKDCGAEPGTARNRRPTSKRRHR